MCYNLNEYESNLHYNMLHPSQPCASFEAMTPLSLEPRHRSGPYGIYETADESLYKLFHSHLDNGPLVGHIAGAFTLLWFNPWSSFEAVCNGAAPLPSLHLSENFVSFMRYLKFIVTHGRLKQHTIMVALLYVHRFCTRSRRVIQRHPTSEARILVTALMLADKHEDDVSYRSSTWAKLGRIPLAELRRMELEFLSEIDFDLFISPKAWSEFGELVSGTLFPVVESVVLQ